MKITDRDAFIRIYNEAEISRVDNKYAVALNFYLDLLQYRLNEQASNKSSFTNYDAIIIERLADLAVFFGVHEASFNLLKGLGTIYASNENVYLYIHNQLKLASIVLGYGDVDETRSIFIDLSKYFGDIQSIDLSPNGLQEWEITCYLPGITLQEKSNIFSSVYFVFGNLLACLGQYADSLSCFERCFYFLTESNFEFSKILLYTVHLSKIRSLIEQGVIKQARENLQQFEIKHLESLSSVQLVNFYELKAKICFLTGDFGSSLELYHKVIHLCRELNFIRAEIKSYINLANIKIYLNQVADAEKYLDYSLQIAESNSFILEKEEIIKTKQLAILRTTFSDSKIDLSPTAEFDRNSEMKKQSLVEQKINYNNKIISYLGSFDERGLTFQILLGNRDFEQAKLLLSEIKQVFTTTDSRLISIRIRVFEILYAYYYTKSFYPADVVTIIDYFKEQSLLPELYQIQRIITWDDKIRIEDKAKLVKENSALLQCMTDSLSPDLQATYLLNKWTQDEEALADKINDLSIVQQRVNNRSLLHLGSIITKVNNIFNLIYHIDKYKRYIAFSTILKDVTKQLQKRKRSVIFSWLFSPGNIATISFLVLPDRILIIYFTRFKINFKITYISRTFLRELVQEWYEKIASDDNVRAIGIFKDQKTDTTFSEKILHLSEELSDFLQIPEILNKLPKRIHRIRFIPDDILNGFPFTTIRYKNEFVVKNYAVSIGYEHFKSSKPKKKERNDNYTLVAISKGTENYSALPGSKIEIEKISAILKPGNKHIRLMIDNEANKENIMASLNDSKIFHIACHGKFEHNKPELTGLYLTNEEIVSLKDIITNAGRINVEHVTLSSCWAADHFILPGRWVISLPESLWRSGVDSILGCMWQVNDEVAISFMSNFYHNLRRYPRDIALQQTQKLALENKLPDCPVNTENPFYWSGFNLYGIAGKLEL